MFEYLKGFAVDDVFVGDALTGKNATVIPVYVMGT